jgi:hypothetical protein
VKTFYLLRRIDGNLECIRIGRYPAATPEVARSKAEEQPNAQITMGQNTAAMKREVRGGMTLGALFDDYLSKPRHPAWHPPLPADRAVLSVCVQAENAYAPSASCCSSSAPSGRVFRSSQTK